MTVVSVDLAYKDYRDFGVAILRADDSGITITLDRSRPVGRPTAVNAQTWISEIARSYGATHVILDGPQGWKSVTSVLVHARICERELNTPAKTGLIGTVKPKNYTAFAQFSVDLFEELTKSGMHLYDRTLSVSNCVLAESFPLAAWRSLDLRHLPAKSRCKQQDLDHCLTALRELFRMQVSGSPSHDELQAIVAGLGGLQLAQGGQSAVRVYGSPPVRENGHWCEGYIVCPILPISSQVV